MIVREAPLFNKNNPMGRPRQKSTLALIDNVRGAPTTR
ncbi:hypothetical protein SAMN05421875_10331 [Acidovorax soli]|uniref:Uncharacterized protein n=1 Tax=Acidovorax soli TaxID=592050 RepID=A0A1H3WTU2_9BURK|nr:hypothetical protein SAMN05421875_10331 [Acidovorax soli]